MSLLSLSVAEKGELSDLADNGCGSRMLMRYRIILTADKSESVSEVAEVLKTSRSNVNLWLQRFKEKRMDGLSTGVGRGPKPANQKLSKEVQQYLAENPVWQKMSQRELAQQIGVSLSSLNRELRRLGVSPTGTHRGEWRHHAVDKSLLGLYLDPPFAVVAVRCSNASSPPPAMGRQEILMLEFDRQLTALRDVIFKSQKTGGHESSLAGFLRQLKRISAAEPVELWANGHEETLQKLTAGGAGFIIRSVPENLPGGWPHNVLSGIKPLVRDELDYQAWTSQIRSVLRSRRQGKSLSRPWFRTLVRPPLGSML